MTNKKTTWKLTEEELSFIVDGLQGLKCEIEESSDSFDEIERKVHICERLQDRFLTALNNLGSAKDKE